MDIDPAAVAIDVPDQDGLGDDLAEMDVRLRVAHSEPRPEVADLRDAFIQERLRGCGEPPVVDRVDDEDGLLDRFHPERMALGRASPGLPLAAGPLQSHRTRNVFGEQETAAEPAQRPGVSTAVL
jgi:hypothetical protein